ASGRGPAGTGARVARRRRIGPWVPGRPAGPRTLTPRDRGGSSFPTGTPRSSRPPARWAALKPCPKTSTTPRTMRVFGLSTRFGEAYPQRCRGQICPRQRRRQMGSAMPQGGGMAHDEKTPVFSERKREQLLLQRILVLDGVLDDDNGTLLATQLLTLA